MHIKISQGVSGFVYIPTHASRDTQKVQQVDTRPKGDMTTSVIPLHTSTRPTATVQRPHTLNLPVRNTHHHIHSGAVGWTASPAPLLPSPPPPPPSPLPLSSLPPQMSLYAQTASVDSIGSCSLDVNATGTTSSPATMGEYSTLP
ncbi:hypothetical protein Pmani_026246 [Petrolisthes manimaculis]|uniref:Uncharacterized protein n=1 Tax=Petrolisthes manimaculis TaxID=1843537 RepID=A0AAE1TWT8_9EUCA|nr:hypothetical protein Pmani_026246 [Petrolisthes manimaculis]